MSAGTTAYSIPKIDEKLKELGFGEEVRSGVLLGLSAGIGGLTGDTASVANNVNQTQNNYLNHKELMNKIIEINSCGFIKECIQRVNEKYDEISKQNDIKLANDCKNSVNSHCSNNMKDALDYVGDNRTDPLKTDIESSRKRVLDIANSTGYSAISTLDMRADYFGAMYAYTGQPWFRASEEVSRNFFGLQGGNKFGFSDWISDVGNQIMITAKPEFREIYNNPQKYSYDWSRQRLYNEQNDPNIQRLHEKYYSSWSDVSKVFADYMTGNGIFNKSELLNPKSRINKGCSMMKEVKNCILK